VSIIGALVIGSIKDRLNSSQAETVTLTPAEVQFLKRMGAIMQRQLDELQNHFATEYLRQVACQRFEYGLDDELSFNVELNKFKNNFHILKAEPEK
jgi:hypothetical protein